MLKTKWFRKTSVFSFFPSPVWCFVLGVAVSPLMLSAQEDVAPAPEEAQVAPPPPPPEPDLAKTAAVQGPILAGLNSLKFRSGVIVAAELTTKKIPIKNMNPYAMPEQHKEPEERADSSGQYAFAVVTVKLDPGRSIGMYDYVLSDDANDFPCYGIAKNDGDFDFDQWDIREPAPGDYYRLLYEVLLPIAENVKIQYAFKFKLLPTTERALTIPFSNNGDKGPTPVAKIPAAGILPIDSPVAAAPPPPPKPEKPEAAEKSAVPDDIGASLPDPAP